MFCVSEKMVPIIVKMQLLVVFSVCFMCVNCVPLEKLDVPNDHRCGVEASSNLIHHNPWLVYPEYYKDGVLKSIRCAATLITSKHVVTAAHCVKGSLYTKLVARLGEYDLRTKVDSERGIIADPLVRIDVNDVIVHENYDGNNNDIAVLVLERDAPYTDFIRPICLPTGTVGKNDIFSAAGWGEEVYTHTYAHIKKIIPLPFVSKEDCQKDYKNLVLPQKVVCAGGEEGVDTCRGDSGGPLTLARLGGTELWGVTSTGNVNCGTQGSPGIYTSVNDHLDWIKSVVKRTT